MEDLIFPKVPHKLPTVLSQDEVVRLIEVAPNRLYRMILVLLYATGVRRTEAARIKVEDIDSQRVVTPFVLNNHSNDFKSPCAILLCCPSAPTDVTCVNHYWVPIDEPDFTVYRS